MSNAALQAAPLTVNAGKYVGLPFAWGGRGPEAFDCYGLVQAIYRDMGLDLPEFASTEQKSMIHALIEEGKELFRPVAQPVPGAIVTFAIHPRFVSHIGVVLDDAYRFVHVTEKTRVVVECLGAPQWRGRIRGFYLWKT